MLFNIHAIRRDGYQPPARLVNGVFGCMVQMWKIGTNSPDISCDFQLVLRGRLVAAPTNGMFDKQQFICNGN